MLREYTVLVVPKEKKNTIRFLFFFTDIFAKLCPQFKLKAREWISQNHCDKSKQKEKKILIEISNKKNKSSLLLILTCTNFTSLDFY